jgi:phage shock protein PspC (stress-responsive transcriptional regulator)
MASTLTRSRNQILGGVCAGIAEQLRVDPTLVRIAAALLVFVGVGLAVPVYLVLWAIIPLAPRPEPKVEPAPTRAPAGPPESSF